MSASSMAHAGFEWTPPTQKAGPQIQEMPAVPAAELLPPIDVDIETVPMGDISGGKGVDAPVKAASPAAVSASRKKTVAPEDDLIAAEPVLGFGNDIPLVLAMRQVVPAEYAFIFDPEIDQSMRVSWNGGRPWDVVLEDMVSDAGLGVVVSQKKVWIRKDAAETAIDIAETPVPAAAAFDRKTMPILSATESSKEPMDVVLKNKKYKVTETKPDGWYKKSPSSREAYTPPPAVREDIDYEAISQKHEESYSPSYPRRTPMPVMGDAAETPEVTQEPMQLSAQDKQGGSVPVRDVEMKQPISPVMKPPAIKPANDIQKPRNNAGQVRTFGTSMDPYGIHFWQAEKGDSLRETLANWSAQAEVEMFWGAQYDYRLPTPVRMHGTFPDAIKSLLMVYEGSPDRPVGRLHPNLPDGPSVLVIESAAMATQ